MTSARVAAVLTWTYAAAFGLPAVPVALYVLRHGRLPTFFGLFPMYGGPWWSRFERGPFVGLLGLFLMVMIVAAGVAWLLWNGWRTGAVLGLAVLAVEVVFWLGFALPIPWVIGGARVVLVAVAWRSLR